MTHFIAYIIMMYSAVDYKPEDAFERAKRIVKVAEENKLNPLTIAALIKCESEFDHTKVNKTTKSFGFLQLNPKFWGKNLAKDDVEGNLQTGVEVLAHYKEKCGNIPRAIAAYRSGKCNKVGPQTRKVLNLAKKWERQYQKMSSSNIS